MSSSEIMTIDEVREDGREQFEKLMATISEEFEAKIAAAVLSDEEIKGYLSLTEHERFVVAGKSIMSAIACICQVPVVEWVQDSLEIQNPEFKFELLIARTAR